MQIIFIIKPFVENATKVILTFLCPGHAQYAKLLLEEIRYRTELFVKFYFSNRIILHILPLYLDIANKILFELKKVSLQVKLIFLLFLS